jgi:hypothetical protein
MAPHEFGEERSFASAFNFCTRALHDFDPVSTGSGEVEDWIYKVKRLMSTEGVEDTTGEGGWLQRAREMTLDERREFSNAVDELASYFDREFWSH